MSTINIKITDARKAYEQADKKLKPVLETLFGSEIIRPLDITEHVKNYADACEVLGLDMYEILPYPEADKADSEQTAINAFAKLRTIAKALNEGWEPDWSNNNEYKYYPYFMNVGSGFRFGDYGYSGRCSSVGSRLCFKSSKLAEYAGKQFSDLYNQMFSL